MAENFPEQTKNPNPQISRSSMTPKQEKKKKPNGNLCPDTSQGKKKSFKGVREIPTIEAREEWNINVLKKKKKVLYPEKIYFKNEGEIKTFKNKPKQNLPPAEPR